MNKSTDTPTAGYYATGTQPTAGEFIEDLQRYCGPNTGRSVEFYTTSGMRYTVAGIYREDGKLCVDIELVEGQA